jgi:hypothetical protein
LQVQALNSPGSFEVTTDGAGVVGHAGAALLGELADRLGLTRALGWRQLGDRRRHAGAGRHRPDGLARLRAALAHARAHARAWAAGAHPDIELLIVDADATLVLAHSDAKQGAPGAYKHTFGFAPLLAYLDRGQAPVGFSVGMQIDAHVREAILAHPSQPGRRRSTPMARSAPAPRRAS